MARRAYHFQQLASSSTPFHECRSYYLKSGLTNLDKIIPSTQYFVQYLFASSFQAYLNIKGEIQSKLDYPIAAQPYNYGYRMMIGPLSLENAQLALSELNRRGYRDALLKFYSKSKTSETISLSSSKEDNDEESEQAETIVMPYMLPVFLSVVQRRYCPFMMTTTKVKPLVITTPILGVLPLPKLKRYAENLIAK